MKRLLLIRHAERQSIPSNEVGNDVLLTAKGEQDSMNFAMHLSQPVVSIRSSPISRCVQTAKIIAGAKGYPENSIVNCTDLGDPGFIIADCDQAWSHWLKKGHDTVNQYLLTGKEHWKGFSDLQHSVSAFQEKIRYELMNSTAGLHIWITHDTILATFASRVLSKNLSLKDWPEFLGCLEVIIDQHDKLIFSYSQNGLEANRE